ncbi:hypothetical protein IAT38_008330 [Cryptococcus sp. DSM 104549]
MLPSLMRFGAPLFLLSALLFTRQAMAEGLTVETSVNPNNCMFAHIYALNMLSFGDIPAKASYYGGKCNSEYFKTSVVVNLDKYCNEYEQEVGWVLLDAYCLKYGKTVLESRTNITERVEGRTNFTVVDIFTHGKVVKVNETVQLDQHSFDMAIKTRRVWVHEWIFHEAFGYAQYILLGMVLIVGLLNRLYSAYITRLVVNAGRTIDRAEHAPAQGWTTNLNAMYQKYLGVPALLKKKHVNAYAWASLPTRLEGLVIFIYVLVNIIFTFGGHTFFQENLSWLYDIEGQVLRFYADRTAIMSFYNLPILTMLAGRNDVILWITGWSFASMNIFHRWVARVTVVQGILHSIFWTIIEWDSYATEWKELYWSTGVFATVTMSLLLPFSVKPIREKCYEFFLISHIVLAIVTIVLLFYHVTVYDGQYDPFLWVSVAVWALDRFIRIVRVQVLSWKAARSNNSIMHATGGPNGLVRLTVTTSHRHIPRPGVHYYLYTPASLAPWENHPFTIASWEVKDHCTELHFLIGTMKGATRRLRRKLDKAQDEKAGVALRVLVEGPYGHTCPIERFDHVLLIGGGSGITAALPYLYELRQQAAEGKCIVKEVTVVWVVKNSEYAADVLSRELAGVQQLHDLHVTVNIYVTSGAGPTTPLIEEAHVQTKALAYAPPSPPLPSPSGEKDTGDAPSETTGGSSKSSLHETVLTGRANMAEVLQTALGKLVGAETLAVLACGPGGMMDDMRAAVVDAYGTGEGKVSASTLEYFEESFSW